MTGLSDAIYNLLIDPNGINLNASVAEIIIIATNIVIWILIGVVVNRVSKVVLYKVLRVKKKGAHALTVANLLRSVLRYVVWFIVIMIVLSNLGVDLTPFIASAGVIGLAIGFGAQEIVRDFMSGFFIIFDSEFEVGEIVEIDGFKGTVLTIGLRTTVIENWKGERKIINNGNINGIVNFSRNNSVAIVDFGVSYDTDLLRLSELMPTFLEETRGKYEMLVDTPSFLGVVELAGSSINLRVIAKTLPMKHFQIERDIRKDLVLFLNENNIEIPFPQVVVHNAKD